MLVKTNFPWLVTLRAKDIYIGVIARVLAICYIVLPAIVRRTPLVSNSLVFGMVSTIATAMLCTGCYLTNRSLHRLFSFMLPSLHGFKKVAVYILLLLFPLPLLEFTFILRNGATKEVVVPAFLQPNGEGKLSLYHSFTLFETGIKEPNAAAIAKCIRDGRYYASASNDKGEYAISIATNQYDFLCLLQGRGIYMFALVDPQNPFSKLPPGWRCEESADLSSAAIVYEENLDPIDLDDSRYIAGRIVDAIDSILSIIS